MNDIVPRIRLETSDAHIEALAVAARGQGFMQGAELERFADRLVVQSGKPYCLLTANGFSALFLAIKACGWKGLRVAVPAAGTCFAITNAIRSSGNIPVFLDNDIHTGGLCLQELQQQYERGDIHAAVLPTHFGLMQPVDRLKAAGIPFIEDNAQAAMSVLHHGSAADLAVLSFYPTKNLNGVDGGAILTNQQALYEAARDLVYYDGQTHDDDVARFNLRMSNLNAAFANVSLDAVPANMDRFDQARRAYDDVLARFPTVSRLGAGRDASSCLSKYIVRLPDVHKTLGFKAAMMNRGIGVSAELSLLPTGAHDTYPNAGLLARTTISVPFRESLSETEINAVVQALDQALTELAA